jgi:hypothetical protein
VVNWQGLDAEVIICMLESCGEALEWTGTHIISVASQALPDGGSWRSVGSISL